MTEDCTSGAQPNPSAEPNHSAKPLLERPTYVHATAVLVGESGVLIRGVSGAGKSKLAQALLAEVTQRGCFARLVGDDRLQLSLANGRLLVSSHPAIAGQLEERGVGLLSIPHETAARLVCVIDLDAPGDAPDETAGARLPELAGASVTLLNVALPRLRLPAGTGPHEAAARVSAFLRRLAGSPQGNRVKAITLR